MFQKKEKLYVKDLVSAPIVQYPYFYSVSNYLKNNELFQDAVISLHSCDFTYYKKPKSYEALFLHTGRGGFCFYKESHIVGLFGGKLMYLEAQGWKSMPLTNEVFELKNWLVA